VAYPLSTRQVEELILERGMHVDHATINRWVIKYSPQREEASPRRKRPVWVSWRFAALSSLFVHLVKFGVVEQNPVVLS
jgi:transposase-like protein